MKWEIRLAAYRYAARITDAAWEPKTVISGIGPIEDWLADSENRAVWDLKCRVLDEITTNLGLSPRLWNPAVHKQAGKHVTDEDGPRVPDASRLVEYARQMLEWVRDD